MPEITGIYARQSVDKKDSISIESQIEFCKGQCINETLRIYMDRGYSGKDIKRPDFTRLLRDIRDGAIKKVVVYKLDRMSRSLLDFANLMELFKKHQVEFLSTQEKFDTSTPMGNAMLSITMVFAQLERETIQQRITDNYYQRGKRGMFLGGKPPFGFEISEIAVEGKRSKMLKAVAGHAGIVETAFQYYATERKSLGEIARLFNQQGIRTQTGGEWSGLAIREILRNPNYVQGNADVYNYYKSKGCIITNDIADFANQHACYCYGKRAGPGRKYAEMEGQMISVALHKGFIEPELFLACQYRMDDNQQIPRDGMGRHTWLSGLLKCGKCGYCMTVVHTVRYGVSYLRCAGKSNGHRCPGHTVAYHKDEIERLVERQLFCIIREHGELCCQQDGSSAGAAETVKMELAHITEQIERLIEQVAEGDVVSKYIKEKIAKLDSRKRQLQEWQLEQGIQQPSCTVRLAELAEVWPALDIEVQKEAARAFIEKVILTDGEINIVWKHRFHEL